MEKKNFYLLNDDELRAAVAEVIEDIFAQHGWCENKPFLKEGEWLSRNEVCDMLHITYTTLWRKEKEGVIKKHKIGRRNLYSKKEVTDIFSSAIEDDGNKCKEECHG